MLVAGVALGMLVGLVCTLVPLVPGLLIIWAAGLVYGLVDGFGAVGSAVFLLMTALLIVGSLASWVLPHRAGARAGASSDSLRLGIAGAAVGFFVLPVVGLIVGGIAGVYLGERRRLGDGRAAWKATRQVLVGFGAGALTEIAAAVVMILGWVVWAVAG